MLSLKYASKYSREGGGRMQDVDESARVAQAEGLVDLACAGTPVLLVYQQRTVCATQTERVSPTNCQPSPSSTPSLGVGAAPGPKLSPLLLAMFLITEHQH